MDSLAPIISWVKRNKFWIGSFIVSVLVVVGWYLASIDMQEKKQKLISNYKKDFRSVEQIRRVPGVTREDGVTEAVIAHPNSTTAEKMNERLEATASAVIDAWKIKRNRQEPLLQFSKEELGEETFQFLSQSKAPELLTNGEHYGTKNEKHLKRFRQQIPKRVSALARAINCNWEYDEERLAKKLEEEAKREEKEKELGAAGGVFDDGGFGRFGEQLDTERNTFAVIWNETNQRMWRTLLTDFQNWDDNVKATVDPTLLQVHMLQQDIWLLEAVFDVIGKINGKVTTNDLAVIKEIHHIAFGREARANLGAVMQPDPRLGGAKLIVSDAFSAAGGANFSRASNGNGVEGATQFDIDGDESPFHGRYVDVNLEPVTAEAVRAVVAGEELPESNIELVVSKRVPFRIALRMDERRINAFLAQCGNSPFEFEVLQLRINRYEDKMEVIELRGGKTENQSAANVNGGNFGLDDELGLDGGFGLGGGMMSGMETTELEALEVTPVETRLSYDVDVEYYGVVKIYNPVRENYLRKAVGLPVEEDTETLADADNSVATTN